MLSQWDLWILNICTDASSESHFNLIIIFCCRWNEPDWHCFYILLLIGILLSSDLQKEQMMLLSFKMLLSVYLFYFNRWESNRDNVWSSNIHRCLAPKAPPTGLRMRRPRHVWQKSKSWDHQSVRISKWYLLSWLKLSV